MKIITMALTLLITFSRMGFCDVTVENFELLPSKGFYQSNEPIDAILFVRTPDRDSERVDLDPYDIFYVYIYRLGAPEIIIAQKNIDISEFPERVLPGKTVLLAVPQIVDSLLVLPGTYILGFHASYHHGGLPYNIETRIFVAGVRK